MTHPARTMPFAALYEGLRDAVAGGLVSEQHGPDGLRLYCYTRSCVYDRKWNALTVLARGLVLDPTAGRVVATPFPKFFNVGERLDPIPDLPFETFEKLDGSLIIVFHHNGKWMTATKGAFNSPQARWAAERLADTEGLVPGTTYLVEAIGPSNRVVIRYDHDALVLLAAYDPNGEELDHAMLSAAANRMGWQVAPRHSYSAISELLATASTLPPTQEGFVVRFASGLRLKVKGDEYRRIHSLVSRVTPLAMWEAMQANADLSAIRRDLPEEFWADFDGIIHALEARRDMIIADTRREAEAVAHLSDKDVGLRLAAFPDHVRPFIFPYRKDGGDLLTGRTRQALFRAIRPTRNELPGYVPSYAMNRVLDEAA